MIDSWTGAIHVVFTTVNNFQCMDFSHHDRILFGMIGNCQESSGYPVEFRNFGLPNICFLFFFRYNSKEKELNLGSMET